MRLNYSTDAENEIDAIYDYLFKNFGEKQATEKITNLYKSIELLIDNPFMGKSVDGHDQNLRTLFSKPNIILYDIDDNIIEILHIVDARTNYKNNLKL